VESRLPPYIFMPEQAGAGRDSPEESGIGPEHPGIQLERRGTKPEQSGGKPDGLEQKSSPTSDPSPSFERFDMHGFFPGVGFIAHYRSLSKMSVRPDTQPRLPLAPCQNPSRHLSSIPSSE
jgi:hypothetical protein